MPWNHTKPRARKRRAPAEDDEGGPGHNTLASNGPNKRTKPTADNKTSVAGPSTQRGVIYRVKPTQNRGETQLLLPSTQIKAEDKCVYEAEIQGDLIQGTRDSLVDSGLDPDSLTQTQMMFLTLTTPESAREILRFLKVCGTSPCRPLPRTLPAPPPRILPRPTTALGTPISNSPNLSSTSLRRDKGESLFLASRASRDSSEMSMFPMVLSEGRRTEPPQTPAESILGSPILGSVPFVGQRTATVRRERMSPAASDIWNVPSSDNNSTRDLQSSLRAKKGKPPATRNQTPRVSGFPCDENDESVFQGNVRAKDASARPKQKRPAVEISSDCTPSIVNETSKGTPVRPRQKSSISVVLGSVRSNNKKPPPGLEQPAQAPPSADENDRASQRSGKGRDGPSSSYRAGTAPISVVLGAEPKDARTDQGGVKRSKKAPVCRELTVPVSDVDPSEDTTGWRDSYDPDFVNDSAAQEHPSLFCPSLRTRSNMEIDVLGYLTGEWRVAQHAGKSRNAASPRVARMVMRTHKRRVWGRFDFEHYAGVFKLQSPLDRLYAGTRIEFRCRLEPRSNKTGREANVETPGWFVYLGEKEDAQDVLEGYIGDQEAKAGYATNFRAWRGPPGRVFDDGDKDAARQMKLRWRQLRPLGGGQPVRGEGGEE